MGRLDNTRHELFAQGISSGVNATKAYGLAGYSAEGNAAEAAASRLLRDVKVKRRIAELLAEAAERVAVSKQSLTQMLLEDRLVAHREGQAAAAGAISQRIGRLHGFAFDPIKEGSAAQSQPPAKPVVTDNIVRHDFKAITARYGGPPK